MFPGHTALWSPERAGQDVCRGNDATEDAPISYPVSKRYWEDMGVIHQLHVLIDKMGWSEFDDHAEDRKY